MSATLPNCWEMMKCGREEGGARADELGVCIAAVEGLGHSCWALAGTLCGGVVQGTFAQKEQSCMRCEVYGAYHRRVGAKGKDVAAAFPNEQATYQALMVDRLHQGAGR